jgi:hypothetical protein
MNTVLASLILIAGACAVSPLLTDVKKPEPAPPSSAAVAPAKPADAKARDGSSYEKAIVAKSVEAEYEWLKKNHPGYRMRMQALRKEGGKPFDVLSITTKDGKELDVFFDISSFFGKY